MNEVCGNVPKRVCNVDAGERAIAWCWSRLRWMMASLEDSLREWGISRNGDTLATIVSS